MFSRGIALYSKRSRWRLLFMGILGFPINSLKRITERLDIKRAHDIGQILDTLTEAGSKKLAAEDSQFPRLPFMARIGLSFSYQISYGHSSNRIISRIRTAIPLVRFGDLPSKWPRAGYMTLPGTQLMVRDP